MTDANPKSAFRAGAPAGLAFFWHGSGCAGRVRDVLAAFGMNCGVRAAEAGLSVPQIIGFAVLLIAGAARSRRCNR